MLRVYETNLFEKSQMVQELNSEMAGLIGNIELNPEIQRLYEKQQNELGEVTLRLQWLEDVQLIKKQPSPDVYKNEIKFDVDQIKIQFENFKQNIESLQSESELRLSNQFNRT